MNNLHVKYLLVGGGVASGAAAQAIRERDAQGAVLLVTQESTRPYHRPPLARQALREALPRQELFLHQPGWYAEHQVELRTGCRAVRLDLLRHAVALDSGQTVSYDKLLLATGASPRHLTIAGSQLPGLHYLRTYEDMERLRNAVEKARAEGRRHARLPGTGRGRVVVIGSDLLATELAGSLSRMGLEVDLLLKRELPWVKFAGEIAGRWVQRVLEQRGISVRPHGAPVRLDGDGRVQRVVLPSLEAIPCDFVVAAVGVVANRDVLRGTPIVAEKAILTDPHCRTSIEDVYAAGDCAAIFDPLFNRHRMLDHFDSAMATGALAGRNMTGADEPYAGVSHFATELFDADVQVWGESRHVHHRLVRGTAGGESATFVEFGLTADDCISQVIGVNAVTPPGQVDVLRDLVHRRLCVREKEEAIKDPSVPLEQFPQ